jgi:hypothetical protein
MPITECVNADLAVVTLRLMVEALTDDDTALASAALIAGHSHDCRASP